MRQLTINLDRWEIGSEFAWLDRFTVPSQSHFPQHCERFTTATVALLSLIRSLKSTRIHLPSFFCLNVAKKLSTLCEICWYRDLPTQSHPDFQTLHPNPGDIVLAVNFFGIRTDSAWGDWFAQHSDCILIEDHSHDPFSDWAKRSQAHYAIASLRKTLPLPDGAMLWSPQQLPIPQPSAAPSKGAEYKLSAMVLKQAYLRGAELSKTAYRSLQLQGEQLLFDEMNARASDISIALLSCLDIEQFQQQRRSNVEQFLALSSELDQSDWYPLFQSWHRGSTPFNAVIVCRDQIYRNSMRCYLTSRNIFTAVHWQQPATAPDSLAVELSNRILTIPVDQRYCSDDIQQMIDVLSRFEEVMA